MRTARADRQMREPTVGRRPELGVHLRVRAACPAGGRCGARVVGRQRSRALAQALAEQQHDAVDDEERRGRNGFAQVDAEDVLQRQARDADGNRREDEQPRQTLVGRAHLAAHDAGDQTAARCAASPARNR